MLYRFTGKKHTVNGEALAPGAEVELTEAQAYNWRDKFVPVVVLDNDPPVDEDKDPSPSTEPEPVVEPVVVAPAEPVVEPVVETLVVAPVEPVVE